MQLRKVEVRDAEAVVALWTAGYFTEGEGGRDRPYERAEFDATAEAAAYFLVAELADEVVGVVALLGSDEPSRAVAVNGEAELARLVVSASVRRRGVGRVLTQRCTEIARKQGWPAIALWSRPYQTAAHRLYESLGYVRAPARDSVDASGFARLVFRLEL